MNRALARDMKPGTGMGRIVLDRLSTEDLTKLCVVAFWFGLGSDRAMRWGDTRGEMELFLSGVPDEVVARFARFLEDAATLHVSDDHEYRVAKLPAAVKAKAEVVHPEAFTQQPAMQALAQVLSPEDSDLLARWATWASRPTPPPPPETGAPPATTVGR